MMDQQTQRTQQQQQQQQHTHPVYSNIVTVLCSTTAPVPVLVTVPTLTWKKKILINISVPIKNATRTTQVARTDETGGLESSIDLKCSNLSNTSGCLAAIASFFPMMMMMIVEGLGRYGMQSR
jgi:hypothetical protein